MNDDSVTARATEVDAEGEVEQPDPQGSLLSADDIQRRVFGSYKAEWLGDTLFGLFKAPHYFPDLMTNHPCILIGGRGTGKTTVLRMLSYIDQYARSNRSDESVPDWPFYGLYYKVNTNRVNVFRGPELTEDGWQLRFAHYLNLLLCNLVLTFLQWYQDKAPGQPVLNARSCHRVAVTLHLPTCETTAELAEQVDLAQLQFEAYINNVAEAGSPRLSMQGQPVDTLLSAVKSLPQFANKHFFFILDEYENFDNYQQRVVNTLIKHAGDYYTFKVGVKEEGIKERATLDPTQQLQTPADYVRIHITERLEGEEFDRFARDVFNERLARIASSGEEVNHDVSILLPRLSDENEALELGVASHVTQIKRTLSSHISPERLKVLDEIPALQVYLLRYWATSQQTTLKKVFEEFESHRDKWKERYGNYKYAALFTINKKAGVTKYYTGWSVFTQLAAGNIRYLLELVDQSLATHRRAGHLYTEPISFRTQTIVAQAVGKKYLADLEGLDVDGTKLKRLLLALGRVFGTMAEDAEGHAPEVVQFELKQTPHFSPHPLQEATANEAERLLKAGIMHLALVRFSGTKLDDEGETKDYDYMIHPIFAAFFKISFRRKRKMVISDAELMGLVRTPTETIPDVLRARRILPGTPQQFSLWEDEK